MDSRRQFLEKMTGLAGTLALPAQRVAGASERLRLGVIGCGARGSELVLQALRCPNTEVTAFADIYTRRLEDARRMAPAAATYSDYRRLLDDKSIDAVIVATPQHLHCQHFVDALDAGKHVYQEKTMAFTVEHAWRMREAFRNAGNRVVQIGHQSCSAGHVADATAFLGSGNVGRITAIAMRMYRNTPHGKPQWSRPLYPDMTPANIQWDAFLGGQAPDRPFDANRYLNWRLFDDYSGGNVYENMCHQIAFWYKVLNLGVPASATMTGGIFLWRDGREAPDTMSVALAQPEEMLITWESGFGNNQPGVTEEVLGSDGTIQRGQHIRYLPQKVNRPQGMEETGRTPAAPNAHMQDFLDSIRLSREPACPFDLGWRVSIACRMAVESYRARRTVHWDAENERIV
ncbi:MAG: Gfo/Idh/MocA family oxidoreductase [Bryobacteraceae bacterium]|jgi:predicted dehydrogenase